MAPPLVQSLHQFSNLSIWIMVVSVNLALFVVCPLLVRRVFRLTPRDDLARGADDAFKTLVTLTMALCAFSLVQVEGLHRNVADLVAREGAILLKLDRTLAEAGGPAAAGASGALRAYASSIVQAEWPAMADGHDSPDTLAKLAALSSEVAHLDQTALNGGALSGEIRGQLIQVKDIREARLASSRMGLSPYFWSGILAALLSLILLGWFQTPLEKAIPYLTGIALGLATLLSVLIVSSGIFEGESQVKPEAISRALALMQRPPAVAGPDSPSGQ
jgi:Protein of unknown function (DUF4239)